MWRPHTLAEVARRVEAGEAFSIAMREFLDTFYVALQRQGRVVARACLDEEPARLPDAVAHAYLGAVGEHLALRWGLAVPAWTSDPSRFLRRPYFTIDGLEGLKARYMAESPTAFRRRLIFTEAEPLRRARFPRFADGRAVEAHQIDELPDIYARGEKPYRLSRRRAVPPPAPNSSSR